MNQEPISKLKNLRDSRITLLRAGIHSLKPNYAGLISENGPCRCELHGFEVDLYGNVVVPELCPKNMQHTNQIPKRSVRW